MQSVGGKVSKAGAGMTAFASIPVGAALYKATQAASDLNETMAFSEQVWGRNTAAVQAFAEQSSKARGISTRATLEMTSSFGLLFSQIGATEDQTLDLSKSYVQLASDWASAKNLKPEEVHEKLMAAQRGEYDSLQALIPTINAAAVEERALLMTRKAGKGQLTDLDKALALHQLVVEGSTKVTGDFQRTSGSLANQQRILAAETENLSGKFGQTLQPVALKVLQVVTPLVDRFAAMSPQMQTAVVTTGLLVVALGPLTTALGGVISLVGWAVGLFTSKAAAVAADTVATGANTVAEGANTAAVAADTVATAANTAAEIANTAATSADTVTTGANTVATGANTAAVAANATAQGGLATAVGGTGLAMAALKVGGLAVLTVGLVALIDEVVRAQREHNTLGDTVRAAGDAAGHAARGGFALLRGDLRGATADARGLWAALKDVARELANQPVVTRLYPGLPGAVAREGRQHGGPVWPGGAFMVGERGRELFLPGARGMVLPNALTERLMGLVGQARNLQRRHRAGGAPDPLLGPRITPAAAPAGSGRLGAGMGGSVVVHNHVHIHAGAIADREQIVAEVQRGLRSYARRNGSAHTTRALGLR